MQAGFGEVIPGSTEWEWEKEMKKNNKGALISALSLLEILLVPFCVLLRERLWNVPQNCLPKRESAGVFIHKTSPLIRMPWGISPLANSFCLGFEFEQAPLAENGGTVQ